MINNINLVVDEAENVEFTLDDGEEHGLDIDANIVVVEGNPYFGPYEITPSNATQTFQTVNQLMTSNLVINPIPSNYGLITWDGSTLTVS